MAEAAVVAGRRAFEDLLAAPPPSPRAALTFWSLVLSLAALSVRLTSSPGSRGHWGEPVGLFLAGGLWATSTTTPGEAEMLKDV